MIKEVNAMEKTKTILVVEDETKLRLLIRSYLEREGFNVLEAGDGKQAIDMFKDNGADLALLDVMLPEYDGWTVCREIRKNSDIPVIMLTARGEEHDKLFGFELGADDYIVKPFSLKELMARIQVFLRRSIRENDREIIHIGQWNMVINTQSHRVYIDDSEVNLTPKEYELLVYMASNKNKAFSRENLLERIWGYDFYGDVRTVDTHIKRLRLKLGTARDAIATVRGHGYMMEVNKNV
jgi:DNA-binding response OmpR family regulator